MSAYIISLDNAGDFESFRPPPQPIPAGGAPAALFDIQNPGRKGKLLATFNVGIGGELDTFYITRAAAPGGTQVKWKSGTDFLTPTSQQPETINYFVPQPAGTSFQLLIDMTGVGDMRIWAGSNAGGSLSMEIGAATIT